MRLIMWLIILQTGGLALISNFFKASNNTKPDWLKEYEDLEQMQAISSDPQTKAFYEKEMQKITEKYTS